METDAFSGSARKISRNFGPGTVMSPACWHGHFGGRHQLHLEIRGRDRQLALADTEQHICQYRHGLPTLHHADDRLQRRQ